jgi:hypothetical protein
LTHNLTKRKLEMKLNSIALLAIVAMPSAYAGVDTCALQEPCVDWTMSKIDSASCGLGGDCFIEVCMIVDSTRSGCSKNGGTFSHMCDQTGSDGCPIWNDASSPLLGDGTDPVMSGSDEGGDCAAATGEGTTGQVSGKCEGFAYIKMCQEGVPGQTLYWILKDGSDTATETQKEYSYTYDTGCDAEVSCVNNLERCAGSANQQKMERTWRFKIPDTTGNCDVCGTVTAATDTPVTSPTLTPVVAPTDTPVDSPVPEGSPSGSLGDPHCK